MNLTSHGIYKSFYSSRKWIEARNEAYSRDEGMCCHCDEPLHYGYNVDHIVPINKDSPDELKYGLDNLQTLCIPCHNSKSIHDKENFTRYATDTVDDILNRL